MSGLSTEQEGQIRELIAQGQKITAVKLYRELTGVGLKEAKDAVEAIERGEPVRNVAPLQFDTQNSALLEDQIKQLLLKRQKIQAVKIYREAHNCGLKDAKDAVDSIEVQMRREASTSLPSSLAINNDPFAEDAQRNRRFLVFVLAIVLLVTAGAFLFFLTGSGF
ncbi:MAG: ribosomal protein L7/L12 [Anaerolineales bacterium]|nr:ribosomal protein L7/L12 [Anaerolineales bacterium]